MIERYLFRARTRKDGNIITGSFIDGKPRCIKAGIIGGHIPIDIETLVQCTGFKDKFGIFIYEGDLLQLNEEPGSKYYRHVWRVVWSKGGWALVNEDADELVYMYFQQMKKIDSENWVIIKREKYQW